MSSQKKDLPLLFISASSGCIALAEFLTRSENLSPSPNWSIQFKVLLGLFVTLGLLLFVLGSSKRAISFLLVFRFLTLAIIAIPEGAHFGVIGPLSLAYVLDLTYSIRPPASRILVAAFIVATLVLQRPIWGWGEELHRPLLADLLTSCAIMALVAVVADRQRSWAEKSYNQELAMRRLDDAIGRLTAANQGFQEYAESIGEKSAREERDRITREIHDTVGYTFMNIMMMMQEASLLSRENAALQYLQEQTREQAKTGLNETRRALRLLRATEKRKTQAIVEIKQLADAFEKATGVGVSVEYANLPSTLDEKSADFIIRMLQEGMANALRHGKATGIKIIFWLSNSELIVNLHDNGAGSMKIEEGIGLSGMRERIKELGGRVEVGNVFDGFQINARFPYPQQQKLHEKNPFIAG
jgi:signal transduction histidine kinase